MSGARGVITRPKGFLALGKCAGIKQSGGKDFAVLFSEKPAHCAYTATKNRFKAAPVALCTRHLRDGSCRAVVVNSGVANACTGERGMDDAEKTAELAANEFGVEKTDVAVASTGLIGAFLPMGKVEAAIAGASKEIGASAEHGAAAAEAIMTTDRAPKEHSVKVGNATISGIAKGAGMIRPDMATMLAFICTDADVGSAELQRMLKSAVVDSFNMVSVDGDTSTNDMVLALANGLAGAVDMKEFGAGLRTVCMELARKIAADGEESTKLIEVEVKNAKSEEDAKHAAMAVADSTLVKCAVQGNDPNWGRITCAAGYSGAEFDACMVDVYIAGHAVVKGGVAAGHEAAAVSKAMDAKEVKIVLDLKAGGESATAFGCDMTTGYVRFNSEYHT